MKRIYLILLAVLGVLLSSCAMEELQTGGTDGAREVEISIATPGNSSGTRAPLDGAATDTGIDNEKRIDELDLLVFDEDGKYMYRREAYKLSYPADTYRAKLDEYWDKPMTIHLLANSRSILTTLEAGSDAPEKGTSTWADIQPKLTDDPSRLVKSTFVPLPMWGVGKVTLSKTSAPSYMTGYDGESETIEMLRSVASVDVFVMTANDKGEAKNTDFELTDIFAYYAADRGYVGITGTDETVAGKLTYKYTLPQIPKTAPNAMETDLNAVEKTETVAGVMQAGNVISYGDIKTGPYKNYTFDGIAYQMYVNENDNVAVADDKNRPTRIIVAGYYKQPAAPAPRVKSYYPIDFVYSEDDTENGIQVGDYRPLIRNYKYEFNVTAVTGPGLPSLPEAAGAQNSDLTLQVKFWNKADVEAGMTGKYYATMERKVSTLWRDAGAFDELGLVYSYLDNLDANDFTIEFETDANGTEVKTGPTPHAGATTTVIENDWFEVTMIQTPATGGGGGKVDFRIVAKRDYDSVNNTEVVIVKYRNLQFKINIAQLNMSEEDWKDGGQIPTDL